MPDMHLDDEGRVVLDEPAGLTPEQRRQAIDRCGMCDDDGYHGLHVCDHTDHSAAAQRGMAAVRAALERGGA